MRISELQSDTLLDNIERSSPKNQANLRSYWDLGQRWEFDVGVYYVDHVEIFDTPSYGSDAWFHPHQAKFPEDAIGVTDAGIARLLAAAGLFV